MDGHSLKDNTTPGQGLSQPTGTTAPKMVWIYSGAGA